MRKASVRQAVLLMLWRISVLLTLLAPHQASAITVSTTVFDQAGSIVEIAQKGGGGGFQRRSTSPPQRQLAPQQRQNFRQQARQRFDQLRVVVRQKMEVARQTRDRMVERLKQFKVQARQAVDRGRKFLADRRQRDQALKQQSRDAREAAIRAGSSKTVREAGGVVRRRGAVATVLLGVGTVLTPNIQERLAALSSTISKNQSKGVQVSVNTGNLQERLFAPTQKLNLLSKNDRLWGVVPQFKNRDISKDVLLTNGYIKNPNSWEIRNIIQNNRIKIDGKIANKEYMYVVTRDKQIIIGDRGDEVMPHPTLIGGIDPQVRVAGMLDIKDGKIYSINNSSGHYQPDTSSLRSAQEVFGMLPSRLFHVNFQGYRPHGE